MLAGELEFTDSLMAKRRATSAKMRRPDRFPLLWHLAWASAIAGAAGGLYATGRLAEGPELAALGAGGAAALAGAAVGGLVGLGEGVSIVAWGLAAVAATHLTGGVAGPLTAWCLAPLATAVATRKPSL